MSNPIQPLFNGATGTVTPTTYAVTLTGLASSTAGVGRVGPQIDFQTSRPGVLDFTVKLTLGTSPVAGLATVWLIRDDGAGNRDDGAGTVDAGLTVLNATPIMTLQTKASPASGDVLTGSDFCEVHCPKASLAVTHNTGVALAAGQITYNTECPQIV